jgi:phosphatidylglycerophosphate synthase
VNRKNRYLIIIIAATVFNIVATSICFFLLLLLYSLFLAPRISPKMIPIGFPFLFIAAVILSCVVYQRVLKLYLKKKPLPE